MSFYYTYYGDIMKIYLDLVLILNFFLDMVLLISTGIILKRKINIKLITISSMIGSLSILVLFINISSLELFFFKIFLSIVMLLIAFPNLNIKYIVYNFGIFYVVSIFLGGALYMLNISLSYKNNGLIFFNNGLGINFIVLLLLAPIISYLYIKEQKIIKNKYNNYYHSKIYIDNNILSVTGYIDSGNNLTFKGKPVILINKNKVEFLKDDYRIIPYKVVNKILILKIYLCDKLEINNKVFKNIYLGISEDDINIDGVEVLLNNKLMEEL